MVLKRYYKVMQTITIAGLEKPDKARDENE
jgi:hypothetical protein